MADAMEIIISAVDSASEVFQSIIESASNMASGITDAVGTAGSDFDTIAENASNFSDSVSNIDTSTLEELASELGMDTEEVERLISSAADIGSMSAGFNEVAAAADDLEQEIQDDIDKMEELGSAGDVMAAQTLMDFANGVSNSMSEMADKAGTVQDSWARLGLAAEGAGISMDTMKSSVSSLSDETGRAGSSIRESFITMTSAGITDMTTMQEVFKGASAQAFILDTDVNSLADKFSGMAMKATISEKTLKGTGVTMQELGEAMGMQGATVDEIKQKWSELDTNQRAAALGMAASMNEGQTANDEYKNSWQGLQDQVEIAKGKLMTMAGQVLLPVLVPAMKLASDILNGLGTVIDGVMKGPFGGLVSIVGASAGIFMIAFAGVLALKNILGFLKLEASFAKIEMMALAFAEEFQATGSITSAAANMIGASGFAGLATAAWGAATAVWAAIAPLLPFIAAAALVAIAIYEVGKAFGWWTDVSSMLDAIKAGLTEMWEAFINHPDVQAAIQMISNALSTLWSWIQQAGQAVLDFFGINEAGSFDIVQTLIDGIGQAWDNLKATVGAVAEVFTGIYEAIVTILTQIYDTVAPVVDSISIAIIGAWSQIINFLSPIFNTIIVVVNGLIQIFNSFRSGQIDLPTAVIGALTMLWNGYNTIMTQIAQLVLRIARQVISYGLRMGSQFMNNIMNYIRQLPGKIYSALVAAVGRITSAGSQWVSNARSQASNVVNTVYNTLSSIPGKISSALAGVVSAITKPFEDAYNKVASKVDQIKDKVSEISGGVITLAGEESYGRASLLDNAVTSETNTTAAAVVVDNSPVTVDHNLNVTLDLKNVPANVDSDTLIAALTDRKVLSALTGSSDFQLLDGKAKERLNLKVNRSRGV